MTDRLEEIRDIVASSHSERSADSGEISRLVREAVEAGIGTETVINDALIPGFREVHKGYINGHLYVPEILIASRAIRLGLEALGPYLAESGYEPKATVVMGCVKGDLHDIGKNLVGMLLTGNGYNVVDLGMDVPPEKFVEEARSQNAQIVGLSALITTNIPNMQTVVDGFKEQGLYGQVKIMIGGAPVTQSHADMVGAHGYAENAFSAVDKANELLGS